MTVMTWRRFKEIVERQNVKDDTQIGYIEWFDRMSLNDPIVHFDDDGEASIN